MAGPQFSLFQWSAQLSVCIKYSKKVLCSLARGIFLPQPNPCFPISLFVLCKAPISAEPLNAAFRCRIMEANSNTLDPGYTLDHIFALGSELPAFPSDHLDVLTGHDGEGIHPPTRPFQASFRKPASCPLSGEGNWTSLFHGERMSACEMRQARVLPLLRDGAAFVCAWQWQTADQRGGGAVTNACAEWLTAENTSPLLIFGDKFCLPGLRSGGDAGCTKQELLFKINIEQRWFLKLVVVA